MSIKLSNFNIFTNSLELEKRHPNGIYFNETVLSEIALTLCGAIRLSYDVDLKKESLPALERIMKTHLAKISIYVTYANILIEGSSNFTHLDYDILVDEKLIISNPSNNAAGLSVKIIYDTSAPTLRVLPRHASLYAF